MHEQHEQPTAEFDVRQYLQTLPPHAPLVNYRARRLAVLSLVTAALALVGALASAVYGA